jgi:hypothetical protein
LSSGVAGGDAHDPYSLADHIGGALLASLGPRAVFFRISKSAMSFN